MANVLADASEQDIVAYQTSLHRMRNRTSTDLQQNVYQNRTQFIRISKEAEKLKSEMRTLRHLMSELRANTNALSQESLGKSLPGPEPNANVRDSATVAAQNEPIEAPSPISRLCGTVNCIHCGRTSKDLRSSCQQVRGGMSSATHRIGWS